MSNAITQLAKIIKSKLVRTVNGGAPDSSGNVDLSYMARQDKNNVFAGYNTFNGSSTVFKVDGSGALLRGDAGKNVRTVIKQIAGDDTNGDGLAIGAGGLTVIGGGEAADTLVKAIQDATLPSSAAFINGVGYESPVLASDAGVFIITNVQNPDSSKWHIWQFGNDGTIKHLANNVWTRIAVAADIDALNNKIASLEAQLSGGGTT